MCKSGAAGWPFPLLAGKVGVGGSLDAPHLCQKCPLALPALDVTVNVSPDVGWAVPVPLVWAANVNCPLPSVCPLASVKVYVTAEAVLLSLCRIWPPTVLKMPLKLMPVVRWTTMVTVSEVTPPGEVSLTSSSLNQGLLEETTPVAETPPLLVGVGVGVGVGVCDGVGEGVG